MSVTINDKPVNGGALSRLMSIVKTVFWPKSQVEEGRLVTLGEVAFSNDYEDLDNKPEIPEGIDTVNVTVDDNTGTPSATGSVSGSTLSLAFSNLKGAQGNPGESAVRSKTTYAANENTQTGLAWDTVHVWPSVASLTFTLAPIPQDNEEHQVVLVFDTPADVTSFALNYDSNILWGANIDLSQRIEASTRYEVIISASSMIAVYTKAALPSNS